jgi:hypothetical protein
MMAEPSTCSTIASNVNAAVELGHQRPISALPRTPGTATGKT